MPVFTMSREEFDRANSYVQPKRKYRCRAVQLSPRLELVRQGQPLAVDCEGIALGAESGSNRHGLGRVSIVTMKGAVVYDTFCYYPEDVDHYLPPRRLNLGVRYEDIDPENGAQPHEKVLADVKAIFDVAGIVIGHALHNDTNFLRPIDFTIYEIRDTQSCQYYQSLLTSRTPGLKALSNQVLNWQIQTGDHSSVDDAQATMRLYLLQREQIDGTQSKTAIAAALANAMPSKAPSSHGSTPSLDSSSTILTVATTSSSGGMSEPIVKLTPLELGRLVALPNLSYLAKGRVFDKRTSRYL